MTSPADVVRQVGRGLLPAVVLAAVLSAQSRDTLETRVTVDASEIVFKWSKKHPWDADLIARGASLYAEYRDHKGVLSTQCLQASRSAATPPARGGRPESACFAGNAVIRRDDRTIYFQLPDTLTAEPSGSVCLVLRLPDNRVIPVRQANRRADDTARFQAEDWANAAIAGTRTRHLQQRRQELEASIHAQTAEVLEQERTNTSRGWHSEAACDAIPASPIAIAGSGRPVASPAEQEDVARQVCVMRVAFGRAENGEVSMPLDIVEYVQQLPDPVRDRWLTLRGRQVRQILEDWDRYSVRIEAYRQRYPLPHFGTYADRVPIQSLAYDAYVKVRTAKPSDPPLDPIWVLGYMGSKVEAYERCVTDGRRQLELNYREAAALKTTLDGMPERLRSQEVKSCQASVSRFAAMRAKVTGLREELARLDREIATLTTTARPQRRRDLNEVRCATVALTQLVAAATRPAVRR